MTIKIATAPDSWGVWFPEDDKQVDWRRYLDEVEKAGYGWTELGPWGYLPTEPEILLRELEQRHIKLCGAGVVHALTLDDAAKTLEQRIEPICTLLKACGAQWFVLMDESESYSNPAARKLDKDSWEKMIALITQVARHVVDDYDLRFVVHPHVGTCIETEEEIERLLDATPADYVNLCFDFGHHAYTGADAIHFMRLHAERIPYYHFKNMDGALHARVMRENISFYDAFQMGVMCELDKGVIDFSTIIDFLQQRQFDGFAVVEQDMYPCLPDKPYPIAKYNRDYLTKLGL